MTTIVPVGIQRSMSGQNCPDGGCEEIINARFQDGSWRVTGRKKVVAGGVDYEQVYIHKYNEVFENYIGVKEGRVEWFEPAPEPVVRQVICSADGEVAFHQLNNILLVKDESGICKAVYDGAVGKYGAGVTALPSPPELQVSLEHETLKKSTPVSFKLTGVTSEGRNGVPCGTNTDEKDFAEEGASSDLFRGGLLYDRAQMTDMMTTLTGLYQKSRTRMENYEQGYIFLRVAYELFDGTVTKPGAPVLVRLGSEYDPDLIHCREANYDEGATIFKLKFYILPLTVSRLSVSVAPVPESEGEVYKEVVKKVNVYASAVISVYDSEKADANYLHFTTKDGDRYNLVHSDEQTEGWPERKLDADAVDHVLFYRVCQFDFLNFGDKVVVDFENIPTNPTMPVDSSGWLKTTGELFVYNNRLHLFRVQQRFTKSPSMFSCCSVKPADGFIKADASYVIFLKDMGSDVRLVMDGSVYYRNPGGLVEFRLPDFLAFADSRAYQTEVFFRVGQKTYKGVALLTPSRSYNYAFCVNPEGKPGEAAECERPDLTDSDRMDNGNHVLVSGMMNPYYFPPEYSYLMPGEVVDMAVSTEQISASQIGQFPVYVFTTEGIYALQTGDGNVLYSNVIPISSEIAVGKVLQTKYGIVFPADSGVKLITGREVVNLSEPVNGEPDRGIRRCDAFRNAVTHPGLYDGWRFLSDCRFEAYIREAVMGYDAEREELIVSNPAESYSYVYEFKNRMWHKITEVFHGFSRNIAYVRRGKTDVVSLAGETGDGNVFHLQSRPVKLGTAGFKRFLRTAARGEFFPGSGYLGMYVFGSQNLKDWHYLTGKQVSADVCHLVLPGILHSYRYAVILLGGNVRAGHLLTHFECDAGEVLGGRIR